ncbi:Ig-like domain-containing protein [Flavobacteriaceae bacterium]|nr:Ig-like domain-containing protein [Flavobacteriaceae bacterium]
MIKLNRFSFVIKLSLLVMVCFSIPDEGMGPLELHQYFLQNSPFKETKHMGKLDRFALGLTPDRYFEEIYELTIDPSTGSPDYSSKQEVLNRIEKQKSLRKYAVPGQSLATPWYTIGPNNEAGRTRAAIFDLADDPDYDRVIAGGVSGGLWENTKISDENQPWSRIIGVPGNLAVSVIVQDEDNHAIMYAGTGESYTSGDASGNGIYKSTNGGINWIQVFGNDTQTATQTTNEDVDGYFYINDIVLYDHDQNSATPNHIFAALGSSGHSKMNNVYLDTFVYGLYKSIDSGLTWSRIDDILSPDGLSLDHINDLEVQTVSNRLWMSSTGNIYGESGGSFWYSDDGTNFTKASPTWEDVPVGISRTEIAPSATNTNTHYILARVNGKANFYKTSDNFVTIQTLPEPIDQEFGMSTTDFTRGQSHYDLEIEVDPNNDNIVYAGGINWHRSEDGGQNWSQISKWAPSCDVCWFPESLKTSIVHADQHGLYFHPGDSDRAIVVNDGGVAYASSLSTASDTSVFTDMEDNFITTQFYRVAQTPADFNGSDMVIGGTQDNGTFRLDDPELNKTNGVTVSSGDGAATFFDQIGGDYMITNYVFNNSITRFDYDSNGNEIGSSDISSNTFIPSNEGSFINPAALDSYNDVYFSNAGSGNIRVITDLDTTPATFLISNVSSADDYVTSLEVSSHTTNTTTLFVGLRSGGVKKITNAAVDGGSTISVLRTGAGSVSDIHIGETEDDIYVTYYNYGITSNILYSDDGGTTFVNKEGDFPNIPVFSILHNPYESEEVIIGTELGVWRTSNFSNANPSWSVAEEGMSDVAVYDMVFRGPTALDNRVVAATYGRGIYVGSFSANTNPPVSQTDSITVAEGETATTTTGGATSVLANDRDPDGDPISSSVVTNPLHSSAFTLDSNTGTFTYTHDGTETTTDTFSYRAFDGAVYGNTVSVTINITPVNDCPRVISPIGSIVVNEDADDTTDDLSLRFTDDDIRPLNNLSFSVSPTNTDLAVLSINGAGLLTIDYKDNQTGTVTITVSANDNVDCIVNDVFLLTVDPINDAPVGVADTIEVDEGATATTTTGGATSVLANDTDTERDVLEATLLTPPLYHNGMFSLALDGTFTYEHDGSETTTDSFTYTLSDGANSLTVTVTINISPQNDCPRVISPIGSIVVNEDADDTTDDLSLRFTDDDIRPFPNSLSFSVSPTNNDLAVLSINGAGLLTIDYKDNQTGTVTITVSANDNVDCIVNDIFLLTVDPINDAPVGVADTIEVDEGATATQTTGGDRSVLTNDTDIDNVNSDLTASIVSTPSFGTLTMQNSGTFIYVHDGSETTTDSFVYKPNDGNIDGNDVTVNITINPINDCPEFGPDLGGEITTFDWNEDNDSAGIYALGSRLVDPDSSPLTYTVTWTNSSVYGINQISTGNFDFVPVSNAFGSSVATITVDDLEGCVLETTFTVNVYSVNDCPTLDNPIADISVNEDADDYWIDIRNTFSDIESSTLNFSAMSTNNSLIATSFTATSLIIDFLDNQNGSTNVVLTVTDGDPSCTVDDVFSLTIASVNDLPLTVTEEISVVSGGTVSTLNDGITTSLLANDIDADGNPLNANLITPPINGTLTLQTNGSFVYTHNGSSTSTDTFYYAANDGLNGNTVSVTIYINNPPVAVTDTIAVLESGTASKTTDGRTSLLSNDTDADALDVASLTAVKISEPSHGSLTLNSDGTFIYRHNGDDESSDSFTYSANDGKINSSPITVSITVTGTNDTPVAYDDTIIVPLGGTATTLDNGYTSFATNDIDPDGDTLTVSIVSSPSYGTISLNPGGTFSYVQNGTINAGDSFTYKVNDGSLDSNIANVNVYLSCTPCTESIIEAGVNGISFTYTDCLCKTVRVYVPKGKAYSFCHLDNSINVVAGSYSLISSSLCN